MPAPPRRYEVLDSLRGICACMVALFHFQNNDVISNLIFVRNGWLFVDFFFVLSGFVILASYGQRLQSGYSIKRFMGLRLGRIYPLHLAILVAFIAAELALLAFPALAGRPAFTGIKQASDAVWQVFLLPFFGSNEAISWNYPAWSIAAEMWVYLFIALLFRYSGRVLWPLVTLFTIICAAALWQTGTIDHTGPMSLVRCFFGFALGMAALVIMRGAGQIAVRIKPALGTIIEAVIAAMVLLLVSLSGDGIFTLLAPPLFMLAVMVFSQELGLLSAALNTRYLRWLGLLSYSIYMVHVFVQSRFMDVIAIVQKLYGAKIVVAGGHDDRVIMAPPWAAEGLTLVMLALVIMAAWGTYSLVEKPARDLSRRMFAAPRQHA